MAHDSTAPAVRAATVADLPSIREVLFAAYDAGELGGTERRDLEHLLARIPVDPSGMLVSLAGDAVAGFFAPEYPLLAVDPRHRRMQHGTRLVERALVDAREQGLAELELAPPLGNDQAEAFAASLGFAYRSSLWQLRLPPEVIVPPPSFPEGYPARTFQPDADDEPFVELFNRAFAGHPSPISVSLDIMRHAHARPSFDPANIVVIAAPGDPSRLIAFCRTVLDRQEDTIHAELAHIGVLPEQRGLGLGRELLRWGIHHLRSRGVSTVLLAVEARNTHALTMYERTGFERDEEWPRWAKATG